MNEPLIQLKGVSREYVAGDSRVRAVHDLDLTIHSGEKIAIMGASGSGKSTLVHVLGCLDRPSTGCYRIFGREIKGFSHDELANLRREHFGFIFQQYRLLPELSALANVEMPAIYGTEPAPLRRERAHRLLETLRMGDRLTHLPGELSGGQQQRVAIARALINGAEVIFADEPTGALDRRSGEEVLRILDELNSEGKTIVLVTHDVSIARRANRIIELSDGAIVADRLTHIPPAAHVVRATTRKARFLPLHQKPLFARLRRVHDTFIIAFSALWSHKLRTFLSMLGIIIGIASVVCVVALGQGSQHKVLANINSLGTDTLEIFPGTSFADVRSSKIESLVIADVQALADQPYVAQATPTVSTTRTVRFGSKEANGLVNGVSDVYFAARGVKLLSGRFFDLESTRTLAQEVVIDDNTRSTLFGNSDTTPLGRVIIIGTIPCRIIGVVKTQQLGFGASQNLSLYLPYTTVQTRFVGSRSLRSITLHVKEDVSTAYAERAASEFLLQRHRSKDFFILNNSDIRATITSTTATMTLLIGTVAVISLLVGGIGVMNIMLVSVSERVNEIGLRMAVGARQADILRQFLLEAVLVCFIGGLLGIGAARVFGVLFDSLDSNFTLEYSLRSTLLAFFSATLTGLLFGFWPARNASRLDPAVALNRA